jgi:hypothetical protein
MPQQKADLQFPLLPVFILCFAFILLLITLSPYYRTNSSPVVSTPTPEAKPQISKAPLTPAALPTNSPLWQTYLDTHFGFEIKHPGNWATNPTPAEQPGEISFSAPDGSGLDVIIISDSSKTVADYLVSTDKKSLTAFEGQPSKTILTSKKITVAGTPAVQRNERLLAAGFTTTVTYLKKNDRIIIIEALPGLSSDDITSEERAMYDQILSSFKFTK